MSNLSLDELYEIQNNFNQYLLSKSNNITTQKDINNYKKQYPKLFLKLVIDNYNVKYRWKVKSNYECIEFLKLCIHMREKFNK